MPLCLTLALLAQVPVELSGEWLFPDRPRVRRRLSERLDGYRFHMSRLDPARTWWRL